MLGKHLSQRPPGFCRPTHLKGTGERSPNKRQPGSRRLQNGSAPSRPLKRGESMGEENQIKHATSAHKVPNLAAGSHQGRVPLPVEFMVLAQKHQKLPRGALWKNNPGKPDSQTFLHGEHLFDLHKDLGNRSNSSSPQDSFPVGRFLGLAVPHAERGGQG